MVSWFFGECNEIVSFRAEINEAVLEEVADKEGTGKEFSC
jgi:hypothetical protein